MIVADMDGFLRFDERSKKVEVTATIENRSGISTKSTGDIKLDVDNFVEHGEVQEGRIVKGKHMTFRSAVYGTILASDGNICIDDNLSGGNAKSYGGNVSIHGRAINASIEAWDGNITVNYAESCVIFGKSVSIKRAVNCEIVAETLQVGVVEGCAIVGKMIDLSSTLARRDRETIVTVLLPDHSTLESQIIAAKENTQEPKMRKPELKRMTAALRQLSPVQRKIVASELAALDAQPATTVIIEGRFACGAMCQHCESKRVIRYGHANGLQRYRCRACSKTFSALTGTPLSRLHKRNKWLEQTAALQDGQTLREVARTLNIHLSTAHRWRHRFLAAPKTVQPQVLTGIAEADETMFLLSFKGKRIIKIDDSLAEKCRRDGSRTGRPKARQIH